MVYFKLISSDFVIEVQDADRKLYDLLFIYEEITLSEYNNVKDSLEATKQQIIADQNKDLARQGRLKVQFQEGKIFLGDSQTFIDTYGFNPTV